MHHPTSNTHAMKTMTTNGHDSLRDGRGGARDTPVSSPSDGKFLFLSMFFYYTTNDCLMLDYVTMHPPPIHLDTSNHQQTAATNVAPSGDERARDASRAPSVRFLFLFLSLPTCIYNKIDYDCYQTFKHPHCDVSDHQRNSSISSRGSDATVILYLFFPVYFTNTY